MTGNVIFLGFAVAGAPGSVTGLAYSVLQARIMSAHDTHTWFVKALGRDLKGKGPRLVYIVGIGGDSGIRVVQAWHPDFGRSNRR